MMDVQESKKRKVAKDELSCVSISDEQLLGYFMPKESAAYFLGEYGGLYEVVMNTSEAELQAARGIGLKNMQKIRFLRMLIQRLGQNGQKKVASFSSSNDVFCAMSDLQYLKQEQFHVLLLNAKNGLLGRKLVSQGTVNYAPITPREAFHSAIRSMAASVIFVHNHPSGDCQPSKEDIEVTKHLMASGDLLGIPILDHVIIGSGKYYSFADKGVLPNRAM